MKGPITWRNLDTTSALRTLKQGRWSSSRRQPKALSPVAMFIVHGPSLRFRDGTEPTRQMFKSPQSCRLNNLKFPGIILGSQHQEPLVDVPQQSLSETKAKLYLPRFCVLVCFWSGRCLKVFLLREQGFQRLTKATGLDFEPGETDGLIVEVPCINSRPKFMNNWRRSSTALWYAINGPEEPLRGLCL